MLQGNEDWALGAISLKVPFIILLHRKKNRHLFNFDTMELAQVIESYKQQVAALNQRLDFSKLMSAHYRKMVELNVAKSDKLLLYSCEQFAKFSHDVDETSKQISAICNELSAIETINEYK